MSSESRLTQYGSVDLSEFESEELAIRAARGGTIGRVCFGELVKRFELRLYNFLMRRTSSRDDAEELTQEAFARAWERIGTYDRAWRFSTWLFTIGLRLAISRHRKSRRESPAMPGDTAAPDAPNSEAREAGSHLWALAREHLSADQHTALWLRYAEDMEIGEIARVMHKSEVGTRVCLFRARQALAALSESNPANPPRRNPQSERDPIPYAPRLIGGAG